MSDSLDFSPRILMGPGPSNVDPRVLQAMALPTIGHLDPKFINIIDLAPKNEPRGNVNI